MKTGKYNFAWGKPNLMKQKKDVIKDKFIYVESVQSQT